MNFQNLLTQWLSNSPVSDLFPQRCAACRVALFEREEALCAHCAETLLPLDGSECPRCATADMGGHLCSDCAQTPPSFEKAYAAFFYGAAMARAVQRLKYEDAPSVAHALACISIDVAQEVLGWCDALIPIPLHHSRLFLRGYNQASLIAHALAHEFFRYSGKTDLNVDDFALERIHATKAQVGQTQQARLTNLTDAFGAHAPRVAGKKILLVDDVMTTGATFESAARALLKAGACEIRVFCVARTLFRAL